MPSPTIDDLLARILALEAARIADQARIASLEAALKSGRHY